MPVDFFLSIHHILWPELTGSLFVFQNSVIVKHSFIKPSGLVDFSFSFCQTWQMVLIMLHVDAFWRNDKAIIVQLSIHYL